MWRLRRVLSSLSLYWDSLTHHSGLDNKNKIQIFLLPGDLLIADEVLKINNLKFKAHHLYARNKPFILKGRKDGFFKK